ncbi:MAG: hypothetical protein JRG95_25130 [Deltaproteobacteria bacterium]|nr:hypothetical protein [Deltaproteobacteria bacterium]
MQSKAKRASTGDPLLEVTGEGDRQVDTEGAVEGLGALLDTEPTQGCDSRPLHDGLDDENAEFRPALCSFTVRPGSFEDTRASSALEMEHQGFEVFERASGVKAELPIQILQDQRADERGEVDALFLRLGGQWNQACDHHEHEHDVAAHELAPWLW